MDLLEVNADNQNRHPWELSRTDCLISEMRRHEKIAEILSKRETIILDIGCGDGYFSERLAMAFPCIKNIWGVDIFLPGGGQRRIKWRYNQSKRIGKSFT